MRYIYTTAFLLASVSRAFAGFDAWTSEKEIDPFAKGNSVTISYMSTLRSGILIMCNSGEIGITVRAIPGFTFDASLYGFVPTMQFAIDGNLLMSYEGSVGSVGDNLASAEVKLIGDDARKFVTAFADARRQIAIQDGISDRPHLLRARGSTSTGQDLKECLSAQPKSGPYIGNPDNPD